MIVNFLYAIGALILVVGLPLVTAYAVLGPVMP